MKFICMWDEYQANSRTPHGVRGLKSELRCGEHWYEGRTPHGVRGLKSAEPLVFAAASVVAPLTGCVD